MCILHFLGACMAGCAFSLVIMWYSPGKSPIPSNRAGYKSLSWCMSATGDVCLIAQCNVSSFKSNELWSPYMAGPFVSTLKNLILVHELCSYWQSNNVEPKCFMAVPLYAVSLECVSVSCCICHPENIFLYMCTGSVLACAPVSTLTLSFTTVLGSRFIFKHMYTSSRGLVSMLSTFISTKSFMRSCS